MKQRQETLQIAKWNHSWMAFVLILAGLGVLVALMAFSITRGVSDISALTAFEALFRFDPQNSHHLIVLDLRLPRVIASALVGAALAVAGAVMQGVTRNPLADSGLMGLNAGAGFALAVSFAFFPSLSYLQTILICFAGAALGAVMVMSVASLRRGGTAPMRMVLAGAAISALLTALSQGIALCFDVSQDIMFWTVGGVSAASWDQVAIMTPFILGALACAIAASRQISLMSLGEEVAKGLGANIKLINAFCSVIVVVLAGISVSVVGAVGFIGLIIPHITRFLVGVDYRLIVPVSAVLGSLLMVAADLGARTMNPPAEIPVGALIAITGVPFFLYLARNQRSSKSL
mgnify:CR=1 FL=1